MLALDTVREVLHVIAGVLVWPVLAGLVVLAVAMLVSIGALVREAWERRRSGDVAIAATRAALTDEAGRSHAREALDLRLERLLQDDERRRWSSLNRLRIAVRVGPALGLMGTLIPMAMALQGLAGGDMPALAGNLVTAFAATVVGLAISVVAYLIAGVREGWVRSDTQALAFHADACLRGQGAPR